MTDPGAGASANDQQPGATAFPDSAVDPRADPRDPAGALTRPVAEEVPACGPASGTETSASRFEIAPAFRTGQIRGPARRLGNFADAYAQARAASMASALARVKIADYALSSLGVQRVISKMAVFRDQGLFRARLPAFSLAASFPEPVMVRRVILPARDLDFLQNISRMANSWDHGLLGTRLRLAESAAALAAPHQAVVLSTAALAASRHNLLGPLADFAAASATTRLIHLFRAWRETAETSLGLLGGLARGAYLAALRARAAVLNGDDGPVAWFIEEWLVMRATPERIEAVSAALLEEGWDAGIPEDPTRLLTDLRSRTVRQARVLKPIWETRLNHRTIGTLDRTVTTSDGTTLTAADLVPDPRTTEELALGAECEEQPLRLVLGRLKPFELQVTNAYARGGELTWAEAARLAGAADPAAAGERVRRKLKRLGAEHSRRLVQTVGA